MQKNNKTYKIVITLLVLIIFVLTFILCFKSCSDKNDIIAPEYSVSEDFSESTAPEYGNEATESTTSKSSNATKKPMSGANGTQGANDKKPISLPLRNAYRAAKKTALTLLITIRQFRDMKN